MYLVNTNGERVEIAEEIAHRLFGTIANTETIVNVADSSRAEQVNGGAPEDVSDGSGTDDNGIPEFLEDDQSNVIQLTDLSYSLTVLQVAVAYAELPEENRTADIPCPLIRPLQHLVKEHEMQLLNVAEAEKYLVELLDLAAYLKFKELQALCAAYISTRIDEIAKAAPNIMEGAQRIRDYLGMENEWTDEEMEHLRKEMEYCKLVDPSVY